MSDINIERKNLDNQEFLKLREATQKISDALTKRLKKHLAVLKPLFVPRRLLGTYVRSGNPEEVAGSDKAFAELQEKYAAIAHNPFGLPTKLQAPLPAIPNQLEVAPFQYPLRLEGSQEKPIMITSSCRWVLSYHSECSLPRLMAMLDGSEPKQPDDMKQSLIHHLCMVIFLDRFPALAELLEDLRYHVEVKEMQELGGLPVVVLKSPVDTFLPPDEFITQITQLSGIPAFQEIIDLGLLENLHDPLRESLKALVA